MDNLSDETFDFIICTTCDGNGKIVEAVRYCIECCGYCCQSCTDVHKTFPTLKEHNLMEASKGNQASNQPSTLPEFCTERCSKHNGKVVDMYCEVHNEVGCYICISSHHKSCPEKSLFSIHDMINTLFNLGDCKQIQRRLKDTMVTLATLGKSKDVRLQALKGIKNEELEKVVKFQKALESIIKKASDASRNEIENIYEDLEKEIVKEKQDAAGHEDSLKKCDDKLKKAEGNRAQRYVCSKIAEKKLDEVERQMSKQEVRKNDRLRLAFKPNHSLMKYLNDLQGIGMIGTKKRTELYKIKSTDINIKMTDDSQTCHSLGCCLTCDNQLLVTDWNNSKLKCIDTHTLTVVSYCNLDSIPKAVCCINDKEAVVTCTGNIIQFVSIDGNKITPTRQIKTSHGCYGITTKDDKLYVTDAESSLHVHDMTGNLLKTISHDNVGIKLLIRSRHVTFTENEDNMYVCDWDKGVVCYDATGTCQTTFHDSTLKNTYGICSDGRSCLFVAGCNSHNVVQFNEDGKKIGVVVKEQDGIKRPLSVCFDQNQNRLFVSMYNSDVVKMFELY